MPDPIEVRKVPIESVTDASGLSRLIADGVIEAERVLAVIGKTEGNGGVNDYTRILADRAFRQVLAENGHPRKREDQAGDEVGAPDAEALRVVVGVDGHDLPDPGIPSCRDQQRDRAADRDGVRQALEHAGPSYPGLVTRPATRSDRWMASRAVMTSP